jgi:hypothetical protein
VILLAARFKDEILEPWKEAAYKVLVEIAFVKILLVTKFLFISEINSPFTELILIPVREYVCMEDVLNVVVEISSV